MKDVTFEEYNTIKNQFFYSHDNLFKEHPYMDNTVHYKTYTFLDGSVWYEREDIIREDRVIKVIYHSCELEVKIDAVFKRLEFWSSENSKSRYCYQLMENLSNK